MTADIFRSAECLACTVSPWRGDASSEHTESAVCRRVVCGVRRIEWDPKLRSPSKGFVLSLRSPMRSNFRRNNLLCVNTKGQSLFSFAYVPDSSGFDEGIRSCIVANETSLISDFIDFICLINICKHTSFRCYRARKKDYRGLIISRATRNLGVIFTPSLQCQSPVCELRLGSFCVSVFQILCFFF